MLYRNLQATSSRNYSIRLANTLACLAVVQTVSHQETIPDERYREALKSIVEAINILAEGAKKSPIRYGLGLTRAYRHEGRIRTSLNEYERAKTAFSAAIRTAEGIAPVYSHALRFEMGHLYNQFGLALRLNNEHKEAIQYYEKALTVNQQLARDYPDKGTLEVANTLNHIAHTYKDMGDLATARKKMDEAIQIHQRYYLQKNQQPKQLTGSLYTDAAAVCYDQGDFTCT